MNLRKYIKFKDRSEIERLTEKERLLYEQLVQTVEENGRRAEAEKKKGKKRGKED